MGKTNHFIAGGTATQSQRVVIGEGDTIDQAQASGAWLSSDNVVVVEP
jgi:hypothetical protein